MKEQTVSNLKKLKSFHNGSFGADIDRAIKALEQPSIEEWLSSFNTESATCCFTAVQELKEMIKEG